MSRADQVLNEATKVNIVVVTKDIFSGEPTSSGFETAAKDVAGAIADAKKSLKGWKVKESSVYVVEHPVKKIGNFIIGTTNTNLSGKELSVKDVQGIKP